MPKKVICAMSGGVDSSVSAALLKRAGFDVTGIFMRFWHERGRTENRCCSSESEKRARAVARILGIPFYAVNFEREFKKRIVDCFLREYRLGLTPNPCVVCNKEIKFGLFLARALALDADFIATGHYAQTKSGRLFRGRNKDKDQSYFLWKLGRDQLRRVLFPVGGYTKKEVRALARKFKLPVAETPESQEICFVPGDINSFLSRYFKPKEGDISDRAGHVLGRHRGLVFYTIGQRKGIGLGGGPFWVAGKDLKKNVLFVTRNGKDLDKKELFFKNANWLAGKPPRMPLAVRVKIRSRAELASAVIHQGNKVVFRRPQRAVTPGQSVVFYKNNEVLGGGVIK